MTIRFDWSGFDVFSLLLLTFFGIFTRFWVIQFPRHMVLAEKEHIDTVNCWLNGSVFVDTEPPLGSMIIAAVVRAAGFNSITEIPSDTYPDMQYVMLRSVPAFFASASVPLSFFIVRAFGGSTFGALAAGSFFLFETLMVSLGRHIFTDGLLQFFVGVSVLFVALSTHFSAGSMIWWLFVAFESIALGFCLSMRISSIGVFLFIAVANRKHTKALLANFIISPLILFFVFCVQGVVLSRGTNALLVLSRAVVNVVEGRMKNVKRSDWLCWPLMLCSWKVLWSEPGRIVACFGNVATWIPLTVVVCVVLIQILINRRVATRAQELACGWLFCYLVSIFCGTGLGVCDYEVAVMFGIWCFALFMDTELPDTLSGFSMSSCMCVSGFVFILWAPFVYGYEKVDGRFLPYFSV